MKSLQQHIEESLESNQSSNLNEAKQHSDEMLKAAISYEHGYAKELFDKIVIKKNPNGYDYHLIGEEDKSKFISFEEIDSTIEKNYKRISHDYNVSEAFSVCLNMQAMNKAQKLEVEALLNSAIYYTVDNLLYLDTSTIDVQTRERLNTLLMH